MKKEFIFASESVSEGHPDKIADQISDSVLDEILTRDKDAKVACEVFLSGNNVIIAGEYRSDSYPVCELASKAEKISRKLISDIGYRYGRFSYSAENLEIMFMMREQSGEIHNAVKRLNGAGDQGMMFGYAVRETPELMPLPVMLAHKILKKHSEVRNNGSLSFLGPDAKSQVCVRYSERKPVSVDSITVSTQHVKGINIENLKEAVIEEIIKKSVSSELLDSSIRYYINPSGSFTEGGPSADTGLTGRKIIADTYGGSCPHGGGAFSGKDASKVDRSAAYMCRYAAKNIVAAGIADMCLIQVSYAIAKPEPLSVMIDFGGTGRIEENTVCKKISNLFDFSPAGIISLLNLKRPFYKETSVFGHFGRELDNFTWEVTDSAGELKSFFKN